MALARTRNPVVVLGPDGKPLAGAKVETKTRPGGELASAFTTEGGEAAAANPATTDEHGKVTQWLPRGAYSSTVTAEGMSPYNEPWDSAPGGNADIDEAWIAVTLQTILNEAASIGKDTHAKRPAAAAGPMFFFETDTELLFHNSGAAWVQLGRYAADTHAKRPAATASAPEFYYETDTNHIFHNSGSSWGSPLATHDAGTHTARPIPAEGPSFYYETDTKTLFHNSGTTWDRIAPALSGTHAERPAAGLVGRTYDETDTGLLFYDNAAEWQRLMVGAPGAHHFLTAGMTGKFATGATQTLWLPANTLVHFHAKIEVLSSATTELGAILKILRDGAVVEEDGGRIRREETNGQTVTALMAADYIQPTAGSHEWKIEIVGFGTAFGMTVGKGVLSFIP
jgi:hypothetical protein